MSYSGKIYWHDGLMLLPHHFQLLQKETLDSFSFQNKINTDYYYGIIDSFLDYAMLEDGFISFKSFKAIMPSGVAIDIPQNAEIPPYKVKFNTKRDSFVVYVGVPLWSPNSPNTILSEEKAYNTRRMYKIFETKFPNEDTGEDSSELLLRKLNARLFLDDDDMSNYDVMPIMKIAKTVKQSNHIKIVIDKNYIPPVLNLNASAALKELVYKTVSNIVLNAKESKTELHPTTSFLETPEKYLKSLFRLNCLNESGAELNVQLGCSNTAPIDVYKVFVRTIAGLGTVVPEVEPFSFPEYDHYKLFECFSEVTSQLQNALHIQVDKPLYKEISFESVDNNTRSVKLTADMLAGSNSYYLGVTTKMNTKELISFVERGESFKLLSPSLCSGVAVPGVKLNFQHIANEALPRKSGLYFFVIENASDDPVWKKIIDEKEMCVVGARNLLEKVGLSLYTLN